MVVHDEGRIAEDEQFCYTFSCKELHHGLCAFADTGCYAECKALAKNLERAFPSEMQFSFFGFADPANNDPAMHVYFLARVRPRRFHSQITHCMVRCIKHENFGDFGVNLSLQQRVHKMWDFASLWEVAKDLLAAGMSAIRVHKLPHRRQGDGTYDAYFPRHTAKGMDVWPGEYRPPKKAQKKDPIPGDDDRPKPKRQSRKPGIKA